MKWLHNLPTEWKSSRLKAVASLRKARVNDLLTGEVFIGLEHIESWTGRLLGMAQVPSPLDATSEGSTTASQFFPGDVLFGKLRPYLAKAYLATETGLCTTELLVLEPDDDLDARFLLRLLLTREFIGQVNAATFGSRMPRAEWDTIANIQIPVPPLPQQIAIAGYLDHHTARLDDLIAAKQQLLALLAEKRQALITHAVTRGLDPAAPLRDSGVPWLGEIPAHWEVTMLRRVLRSMDYGISESVGMYGNIAILRMGDIVNGTISYQKIGFVDEVSPELLLEPGDLLFNRTNSLDQVGKVGLFKVDPGFPVSFASYLVRMRCSELMLPEYLNHLLNSPYVVAWARSEALPSIGQVNLNPNRYSYLPIPLPPLQEQLGIIRWLSENLNSVDELQNATIQTIDLLQERRSALVAAAVTGQIDVM